MSNPFEKYFQATERQQSKLDKVLSTPSASLFQGYEPPNYTTPSGKSGGDILNDVAIATAKTIVGVPQALVGLADIAGYGFESALSDTPVEYTGYLGKALEDSGIRFKDAQDIISTGYSDAYKSQQAGLHNKGEFNLDNGLFSQNNADVLAAKAAYVADNPALAVNTTLESLGYMFAGGAIGTAAKAGAASLAARAAAGTATRGTVGVADTTAGILANAARTPTGAALAAAEKGIMDSVGKRVALGAMSEGGVSAGILQENTRNQTEDGLTSPEQTNLAAVGGAGVGLLGYGFGRLANKAGAADIDTALIRSSAPTTVAGYLKNNPVTRVGKGALIEGLEEVPQENLENFVENLATDKGEGNILYGAADSTVLGFGAGALMGGAINLPSGLSDAGKDIKSGLGKVKGAVSDATNLKTFDTLSNPEHKNYNPAQAFNLQLKNLESNDETVRTQAQANVSKVEADLNTARATVDEQIKNINTALKSMPPVAQMTDAQKLEVSALAKAHTELTAKSDQLNEHLIALYEAQVTAQDHKDTKQGTQFTEEQAKADIATLTQPKPSQTVWSNQDTDIPVEVVGEPETDEAGNQFTKVRYTPYEGADPVEFYVPTSELVSAQGANDVAQQEALNRVTKHFSKYSNDDLDLLASSPILTEAQRNSLRQLSKSKRELAAVQDPSQVFDNILNGYTGKTIQESHRGLNQYTDMVNTAVATKNEQLATLALDGLGAFTDDHTAKKDTINEAFGLVRNGTYAEVHALRTQEGTWGLVPFTAQEVKAGKNTAGAEYLSKEALNKVGGFNVHINSDKNGAITQINNETQLIQDRFNALSGVAESFVGVTPKPVDTSTAPVSTTPTVDTPVVTESSQRSPKLEEAYKETFSKPIENWDANDFASVGAQATQLGSTFDSKTIDADNAFSQKMAKKIIADGIAKNRSTADIMQDVMFVAYSSDFAMRQSGVDALRAYIELRKAQGTSTTPIVTQPSDTAPPVVTPVPEAPVQSDAVSTQETTQEAPAPSQDTPVVNKDSSTNPVTELLKANLDPTEFLAKAKELGIVGAALEAAKGIYNRTKAKVSITKAVKENKAILQQIEDTKQDLRLYAFGVAGTKIHVTTDEGTFEVAYVHELYRTGNGEIEYKFQVESAYEGFKPNPALKAELDQQLLDLPKQLKPLGKPNKHFKDYFDTEAKVTIPDATEGNKQAPVETKAEPKVKTADTTPPVTDSIKVVGTNTLITSAVSGLTHSVPTKLVNGIFEASYIVKELMAITSKALTPAQREYLEGLLQVFLALDGTVLVGLYADLSLIQNDTIRETLQKSKGKAVDYLDEGKRIYIDLNNVEPVDLFEILVHEYHHTVTMQGLKKIEGVGKSSPQYVRLNAAYKAVKAYVASNPTVDARVLERLKYMLKNLREFLTVGMVEPTVIEALRVISVSEGKSVYDEISAVNAEILKIQNPKTFPTQQGKLNDLVSTTRGNSSGVQTSSSDSLSTPQVESLDTTGNDTGTSNTVRPVATDDGEQIGRGTSEATQGAKTSTESQVEPSAEAKTIYEKLGSKTATGNVQIKYVLQAAGVAFAKSLGGIFSLRVNGVKHHFGNPFSSVPKLLAADPSLTATKSTQESVERYIDWVLNSNEERAKWIRSKLQSGALKGKPIIYYAELGEPSHANALDYLINTYMWEEQKTAPEVTPLKPEFQGKVILAHAGTGKSFATKSNPDLIDGDVLYYEATNTIVDKYNKQNGETVPNIKDVTGTKGVFTAWGEYDTTNPERQAEAVRRRNEIYAEYAKQARALADAGKTVLSSSIRAELIAVADMVVIQDDAAFIGKNLTSAERVNQNSETDLVKIQGKINKAKSAASKNPNLKAYTLEKGEYISDLIFEEPAATEDGKVTVLQGVTDEIREEERNKPFGIRNLIRAYFSQNTTDDETKGSNPLVLIKDFILQSDLLTNVSKYLSEKTKSRVTDAHIAQLKDFQEFHAKFSKVVMRVLHDDRSKVSKDNLVRELLNQENPEDLGTLDENVLTAISLAAYGYLIRFGNTVYNTDDDIRSIVRLKKDQELPSEVAQILRYAGHEAPIVEQQLGEQISKSLALKAMKDSSATLQNRLDVSFGNLVTAALHDVGYIELDDTSISPKVVGELLRHAGYAGNEDSGTQEESDGLVAQHALEKLGKLTFIRPNYYKDPKGQELKLQTPDMIARKSKDTYSLLAPERDDTGDFYIKKLVWGTDLKLKSSTDIMNIIGLAKPTAGFLSKLMGVDVGFTVPTTTEPESIGGNTKQGTNNTVPKQQQKLIKEGQVKAKFSIRANTVNALNVLKELSEDSKLLKQLLGVWYDDDVKARTHIRDRDSVEAKNKSEWDILERGLDWAGQISLGNDEYLDFYDTQYVSQNERMQYLSNFFNIQSSQLHRAMASLAAFKLDISLEDLTLSNENLTRFYQAVGEGLEGLDDVLQASIKKRAGLQQFFTVDKVSADNYVEALQEYLKSDESVKAIDAMVSVLRGNKPSEAEQASIAQFVEHGDMGIQSLQSLIALAEMQIAVLDGKSSFTTTVGLGSDGVNNGVASANILTGVISRDMKQQVGMLAKGQVKTMQEAFLRGLPDYYISFGIAMGKALKAVRERKSTTVNNTKWHDALQELFPVYKAIEIASLEMRKVAKTWSIPFNYGAGKKSLQRALGRGFLDGIYGEMTNISNKALEAKAAFKEGTITKEVYTLTQENLKNKADTLQLHINTILQRGRIAKDKKGNPILLANGKNQYLPRYAIKFPTDLTQLNEYTFGNAKEENNFVYSSMNRDTTQLVEQLLLDAVNAIHGAAAWEATQEYAEKYTKVRDTLNTSNTAAFMLYDGMRTKLIQAKLKQKEDALLGTIRAWNAQVTANNDELVASLGAIKARKSPQWRTDGISIAELRQEHDYLGLTTEEMREIDDILAPINPTLHSALSQETGDLKSGIALATQETAIQKAEPSKQVETKYLNKYIRTEKGFASIRPVLRGLKDKLEVTSGIKSLAMAIQGIDAYVAAYLQAKFPTLNVHDAGIFGLKYFREATKYQNEIYLQAMTTYHLNVEHAEALVRSYLGLKDFIASLDSLNLSPEAKELFIKEAEYAKDDVLNGVAERNADGTVKTKKVMENMFNEETGEMESREIVIEIRTGIYKGLTEALGKLLGYEFDELTDIDSALKLWVSLAISKDLDKLESLKDIKSVHQYSGEGGEFTIGAKGDLEFSEHMRRIEEQRIALLVRKKELLERIDRAGTELNLETASSTRQSQLSKLFGANKGKGIDALAVVAILKSDKSASRSSEQHQRQLQILRAIEPFLKGVKVVYKDMENNEAEGITDRVRGFFEPKTNTIVIRANVIKSDDLALIVHEMLHAALSSRITAIENNGNKDSAEYKALKQLEDLRTQLLDNEVLPVNGNEFLALKAKVEKSGGVKAYDNAKEAIKNNKEYQQAVANKQSIKDSLEQANTQLAELNTKFTETQNKLESSKDNSLTLNRISSERSALKDELRAEQAALQESLTAIAKEQVIVRQQVKALHNSIKQANKEIEALIGKDKQIMQDVRTYHEMRNTLRDTVFVVEGGGKLSALKLVEMLEDIHEFISYGLTETTLQDIMQDVFEVPKGNRKPLSLRGAWKMFISAVGRILRMPNTKTLNALTAFSMDVADLLSTIGSVTPVVAPNNGERIFSTQSAEDHVNGQSSLDIMQALPHSNTGAFNQQLDRLIVEEIGQLYNQDDAAKARIDEIQTFTASDALNAGFTLSRKEQYVQQALQYAVAAYMKLHAGGANVGQLRRVYHAAKVKISPTGKDFHEGDWASATQQEQDAAKAKYDFMFDSTKEGYMNRFVSMALASESVSKILDITLPLTKPNTQDKTWFETVNDWVSYVMAWLTNKYVRLNPTAGASNQLVQLMNNLVKLDIRNRQEGVALHQKAWNTIGLVTTPLNSALKGAGGAVLSGVGLRESRFLPVRALGAILVLRSEEAAKAIPKMIIDMRNNQLPNTKLGEVANILLEASGVGTLRDKFDVLIRQTNLNAKNRQDIVDNVKKAVNKWFKEPLTKAQSKAIAYGLLGTDAQALLENYSVEDIVDMALHEGKLNVEIAKLKKEIAKNPNGNDTLNAAEQLGYYMVTRIGGEGLVKNALGIAIGLGTQYFTSVEQADPKLVGQLNTLVSMLAMTHVPNSDKAILAALYKTDAEGIHATIQLHQGLVNDSLKDFQANPLNMVKGWMPEVTNPYLEIKAANSMVERQQMEAEGWVLIDELKRDKHDKGSPKYLMKHNDIGYQRLVSGAVDLGSTARSGTEAISRTSPKYLGITQARYQNAARRAAIPNSSFDPSKQPRGLIAAYDTNGMPLAYNYEMDNETRDAHLDRKHNIGDLLGTFGGLNYYKPEKAKQSNKVAEVLFEDYKANYSQNPNAYLKISHKSTDPKVVEMWRMLPQDFKQRATELYGKGNPIIIRNEAFNLAFGFKKFSVVSYAFDAVKAERERIKNGLVGTGKSPNAFQSGFVRLAEATRGNTAQADFAKAEHVTQEIVKAIKDFIVIRSGTTMMWNIFANVLMLMANGINPVTIIKDWVFAVTNVRAYQKLNSQLIQAQADLAGGKDPIALKQKIGALKAELKANVMNPYINAGLLSSIVEDVNIQQGEYTYTSAFKQTVDAKTQWIPKPVKTAAAIATIAPSTKLYQFLATTTQLSDFVAKYSMSKHLQANGTDIDASIIEASKTFINYDLPTSQGLQYANDMGLFMFTKFFLRIQAVLMKLLGKRAGSTIAQHLLVENLTGAEGVLSPMAFGHIGNNPLESSVAGLPSAFFGIGTIDAVTDFGVSF